MRGRVTQLGPSPAGAETRPRRARPAEVLLRRIPGDSLVHRLAASTKLLSVAVLTIVVAVDPSWAVIGGTAAVIIVAARCARIPAAAVPRLPLWLFLSLALGLLLSLAGGGLTAFARVMALSILFTAASAIVTWTTAPAELEPALAWLASPLRTLRVPVDEYARAVALCVRCLPLITAETATLLAARRLRRAGRRRGPRAAAEELTDLLTAMLTSALRRADELGDALTARGGVAGRSRTPARPGRTDAAALLLVVAGSVLPAVLLG